MSHRPERPSERSSSPARQAPWRRLRTRLTFANLTSLLALFIALGGTSYAAVKLQKNSVTSREIKNGSVQGVDLAKGLVTSGPVAPRGPRGAQGPPSGLSNVRITSASSTPLSREFRGRTTVLRLSNVAAGNWFISFSGVASLRVAGRSMYGECDIVVDGTVVSGTRAVIGDDFGGDAGLSDMWAVSRAAPFDVSVECLPDQPTAGGAEPPYLLHAKLAAIKVDSVEAG